MKAKKTTSLLFTILFFIQSLISIDVNAFAEEESLSVQEFFTMVHQLVSDNSSSVLDSMFIPQRDRLIVKTKSNKPLKNDFGAIEKVEGYDGLHILQYDCKEDADRAFAFFESENIEYVEYDYWLATDSDLPNFCNCPENSNKYGFCECGEGRGICNCKDTTSPNHLSWNSSAVKVDEAFELAYSFGVTYSPVNVAVIDSGLYIGGGLEKEHFDDSRIDVNDGYYFEENDIVYPSTEDFYYHGTHVSGIIYDNTMSNVTITPYRIFGKNDNYLSYLVLCGALNCAIDRKDVLGNRMTDIINLSLSHIPFNTESENLTLNETLQKAIDNNIVVVVCAGNEADDVRNYIPSNFDNAITVAASKKGDVPDKSYSNYGLCVDVAAPGTDIYSTTPILEGKITDNGEIIHTDHARTSGTSQAAPLVAAAVAFIKSIRPEMTPAEIEKLIKETAYVPDGWDKNYGTGIVNFYNIAQAIIRTQPEIDVNESDRFEILPTDGSQITYYTLDGSAPSAENGYVYLSPLDLSNKNVSQIKAVSYRNGTQTGEVTTYRMTRFETVEINYKECRKLISSSYGKDIEWKSQNPDIVSVDSAGKIKGVATGRTMITAKMTSGKKIIFNVNVEYSQWQKIIIYFFFGFLWYI